MSDSWKKLRNAKEYGYFEKKNKEALEKIKQQVSKNESEKVSALPEMEIERSSAPKEDWQEVDAAVTKSDWKDYFRYKI